MVARDKLSSNQRYKVPKLSLENEYDKESANYRLQAGKKRQLHRLQNKKTSLEIAPPQYDEISSIHQYYFNRKTYIQNPNEWLAISATTQQKSLIMHSQDKNIHGNIFGGYLMREAYELGWLAAHMFADREYVKIKHIHDFQFIQPVKIGDIIQFTSRICYVKDNLIDVVVTVENVNNYLDKYKTNELYLTYTSQKNLKKNVYPVTYEEAMLNCDSRRRIKHFI
eukprot:TRINITY_DN2852_c0_g1_i3.p1 TRINITY_DN2852_c0_g1~~TRINITY_DN2852_c0_g1_i3.p1  ORF type:complete len:224 (-),score=32.03 TRINITY_DN2852_c0_g1_i3:230-901(-)